MMMSAERHILSIIVDNEAGALGRVVGLFSGRGYNICDLTVSSIDNEKNLSRITITTFAPDHVIDHIVTLLERLIPVHKVIDLTVGKSYIERGVILLKVKAEGNKRNEVLHIADSFNAIEVDATDKSFIFQLTDIPSKIDEFIHIMQSYGIVEMARTGVTAISLGNGGIIC